VDFAILEEVKRSHSEGTMNKLSIARVMIAGVVALSSVVAVHAVVQTRTGDVTLTGRVTCSNCVELAQHKGFTPWSWAMYKLSQGDNIVLLTSEQAYKLQGDRQQLTKFIEDKATVSGHLDANTIKVSNITRPTKGK
jgi:hypothetical protein